MDVSGPDASVEPELSKEKQWLASSSSCSGADGAGVHTWNWHLRGQMNSWASGFQVSPNTEATAFKWVLARRDCWGHQEILFYFCHLCYCVLRAGGSGNLCQPISPLQVMNGEFAGQLLSGRFALPEEARRESVLNASWVCPTDMTKSA